MADSGNDAVGSTFATTWLHEAQRRERRVASTLARTHAEGKLRQLITARRRADTDFVLEMVAMRAANGHCTGRTAGDSAALVGAGARFGGGSSVGGAAGGVQSRTSVPQRQPLRPHASAALAALTGNWAALLNGNSDDTDAQDGGGTSTGGKIQQLQ